MTTTLRRWAFVGTFGLAALGVWHSVGRAQVPDIPNDAPPSTSPTAATTNEDRWAGNAERLARVLGDLTPSPKYQTIDLDWTDTNRQRQVPVRLYLPNSANLTSATAKPFPLVVFSHGLGGSRLGYSYMGRYFAEHGVASLHLQHVGSDRKLWSGSIWDLTGKLKAAARDEEAIHRAQDVRFALDTLLAEPTLGPQLDAAKIVAAGHSYGANTSMLVAGAEVQRDGQPVSFKDPRIKGVILISAPPFYGTSSAEQVLKPVTIPSLHITAADDIIRVPGYYSAAEDRIGVFNAFGGLQKTLVVFKDGSHSIFTDRLGTGGNEHNPAVKKATRELALAFVQSLFAGRPLAEQGQQWAQTHQTLIDRYAGGNLP